MSQTYVITFGYLHGDAPTADITLDLRRHFRDPHTNPELRHCTADDPDVRAAVLKTPGIRQVIDAAVAACRGYLAGPGDGPVTVAVGCSGGRHRAATVGRVVATALNATIEHRDLDKPVVDRAAGTYIQEAQDTLRRELPDSVDGELLRLYTLLMLACGKNTTVEAVHDAWALWRSRTAPGHECLVPFEELSPRVQAWDVPYVQAIHHATNEGKRGSV